ncbi:helix-turn-helix transcriptional regulator [Methylobacterium nodulans]|uniref:Transcriptional regulator, AraC family n=1 Tax=Methylobacterium nodulans (strain LMG 21967 / CNCM I-2342 / ORS 2060) TaxID=460265 RepID=B8IDB6_METNO|nr:AraC family transcriptional regulator [Methylobacterium nodulans]ACL61282.1 transcriptional regulator, AraC family [Methylobacterium nodulans ORS 2060]
MAEQHPNVRDVLARTGAALLRSGSAGRGIALAEWVNRDNHARYDRPDHHTLSLYLTGGEGVVREDRPVSGGGPDKLCLLPAGHESCWHIGGQLRLFHLYIEPETLAFQAATAFDIDPRRIDLMELTFSDDPSTAMIVRGGVLPLDWADGIDRMALSSACHLLLHNLLRHHNRSGAGRPVTGGLSPSIRRRIADQVEARLGDVLTLDVLADEAGLSTFHFAKMFKASFGVAPHRYVIERRIARAKSLLADGRTSLAEIAAACGFASQSHFTRSFKQATGATPGQWRGHAWPAADRTTGSPSPSLIFP